jgi:LmbE family N-acetylglucosaminyl deacetylase
MPNTVLNILVVGPHPDDQELGMGGTIKVLHQLRPIGVAMAGSDVYDPYKD